MNQNVINLNNLTLSYKPWGHLNEINLGISLNVTCILDVLNCSTPTQKIQVNKKNDTEKQF